MVPDDLRPPRSGRPSAGGTISLAALTTVDGDLYEAARIDGANRWRQTWHVTLPGIRPTMVTPLILNIGTFSWPSASEDPAAVPTRSPTRRRT
ncbi:ABC transporter permease subunit [Micromonospora sp. BRA006-A]|nr:ABC transporter permease subunit [Micromonospora sp. BRA006-A]